MPTWQDVGRAHSTLRLLRLLTSCRSLTVVEWACFYYQPSHCHYSLHQTWPAGWSHHSPPTSCPIFKRTWGKKTAWPQTECAVNNNLPLIPHNNTQSAVVCLPESPACLKSSRRWCCTSCGRTARLAPWMTLWRNTWRTSPSRTRWGRRGSRSWNTWQMASYFWTAGRFRSAPHLSPCGGWPASFQVRAGGGDYTKQVPNPTEPQWAGRGPDMSTAQLRFILDWLTAFRILSFTLPTLISE